MSEEQRYDWRPHCCAVAIGTARESTMNCLLPRLAAANTTEHLPRPGPITATPSITGCESLCQPIGGDVAIGKERLGEVNRHLCVVGPPRASVARLSDEPPDASFQRAALVGSSHCIARGEPYDTANEAFRFHVNAADSRPLPRGLDQWLPPTGLSITPDAAASRFAAALCSATTLSRDESGPPSRGDLPQQNARHMFQSRGEARSE